MQMVMFLKVSFITDTKKALGSTNIIRIMLYFKVNLLQILKMVKVNLLIQMAEYKLDIGFKVEKMVHS
jgi:hypothetical protein